MVRDYCAVKVSECDTFLYEEFYSLSLYIRSIFSVGICTYACIDKSHTELTAHFMVVTFIYVYLVL